MTEPLESARHQQKPGFVSQVLPAIAYTVSVFYGGLIRLAKLPESGIVATDKLLHALAFGGLALLLARAIHWLNPRRAFGWKLVSAGLGSSLLGLLLELCQACVSYRSADVWDWVADSIGAALAMNLALAWRSFRDRRALG